VLDELEIIGARGRVVTVLNKIDRIPPASREGALQHLRETFAGAVMVSATSGEGVSDLAAEVRETLGASALPLDHWVQ
jgi:50S ribosomal subunit-associated GTPase HflX